MTSTTPDAVWEAQKNGLDAEVDINNNCRKAFLAKVFQNFPELRENLHRKINRGSLSVVLL